MYLKHCVVGEVLTPETHTLLICIKMIIPELSLFEPWGIYNANKASKNKAFLGYS